jgi:hypothetical protein
MPPLFHTTDCLLIVHDEYGHSYYALEGITEKEYGYLNSLEMVTIENVLEEEEYCEVSDETKQAFFYVYSALGMCTKMELETYGYATEEILAVKSKWENKRFEILSAANKERKSSGWGAVFVFSTSDAL